MSGTVCRMSMFGRGVGATLGSFCVQNMSPSGEFSKWLQHTVVLHADKWLISGHLVLGPPPSLPANILTPLILVRC